MKKKGNIFVLLSLMVFLLGLALPAGAGAEEGMGIGKSALPVFSLDKVDAEKSTNINTTNDFKELAKKDELFLKEAKKLKVHETYGNIPLSFIQNDGQMNEKVEFYERGNGHSTFFTKRGVYLGLTNSQPQSLTDQEMKYNTQGAKQQTSTPGQPSPTTEFIKFIPLGANKEPEIVAEDVLNGKVNYFSGNDPEKWKTNIPTYQSIVYKDVYDGIDMKFYGNNRQMEYDIVVKPGASPSRVQLAYQGIEGLKITDEGNLEIALKEGKVIHKKPYVYQEIEGKKIEVEGRFKVQTKNPKSEIQNSKYIYGFQVASYNKQYPLVIDPVLVYSTYLGGIADDSGDDIAIDSDGNVYITGTTWSADFPTVSAIYGSSGGGCDAFVTKINASGTSIIYSTYLGGWGWDYGNGISIDTAGNAYIVGFTGSTNFPIVSAFQGGMSGNDVNAFVTKIDPSGANLVYSTYLGGSDWDKGLTIAVGNSGNAYVAGYTYSTDFPTVSALSDSSNGEYDVFVSKISASGTTLVYSTYLGGDRSEIPYDIAIDTHNNIYITGTTGSSNFPLVSAIDGHLNGGLDAFITKIDAAGTSIVYSTYLGGDALDRSTCIAVDADENVYVTGFTESYNFPTTSVAFSESLNGAWQDAFFTKIDASGANILYSTYLGGTYIDYAWGIATDNSGNTYSLVQKYCNR